MVPTRVVGIVGRFACACYFALTAAESGDLRSVCYFVGNTFIFAQEVLVGLYRRDRPSPGL